MNKVLLIIIICIALFVVLSVLGSVIYNAVNPPIYCKNSQYYYNSEGVGEVNCLKASQLKKFAEDGSELNCKLNPGKFFFRGKDSPESFSKACCNCAYGDPPDPKPRYCQWKSDSNNQETDPKKHMNGPYKDIDCNKPSDGLYGYTNWSHKHACGKYNFRGETLSNDDSSPYPGCLDSYFSSYIKNGKCCITDCRDIDNQVDCGSSKLPYPCTWNVTSKKCEAGMCTDQKRETCTKARGCTWKKGKCDAKVSGKNKQ